MSQTNIEITLAAITAALAPTEAILRAEYLRQLTVRDEKVLAELAADGWDANKRYDYPSGGMSKKDYRMQVARFNLMTALTDGVAISRSFNDPNIRKPKANNAARRAKQAAEMAQAALGGYCGKLAQKINHNTQIYPAAQVKYTGSINVWGWSSINVVLANGERQVWETKMIVNVSCLGKVFNQWPTRRIS